MPVGADFDKPLGQHVLEEALDEVLGRQSEVTQFLGLVVAIAKSDLPIFKLFQPAVADGDPKDVAGQVSQDLFSRASVPAVDISFLIPARATRA